MLLATDFTGSFFRTVVQKCSRMTKGNECNINVTVICYSFLPVQPSSRPTPGATALMIHATTKNLSLTVKCLVQVVNLVNLSELMRMVHFL